MLRQNPAESTSTSFDGAESTNRRVPTAQDALSGYGRSGLPWYGLDAGWQGPRGLGALSTGPDGIVEFGTLRHGDPPATRRTPGRSAGPSRC